MIASLEEVRQSVMTTFKTAHQANYPTTLVNYPNLVVVDLEHQKDPFVSLRLSLSDTSRTAIGEEEIYVNGTLEVYFYYREGTGTAHAANYTDMLNTTISMNIFDSLGYREVKPINIKSFPGWEGCLNSIEFDLVAGPTC